MSHITKIKLTQLNDLSLMHHLARSEDHLKSEMIEKMKLNEAEVGDLYWAIKPDQIKVWLENADQSKRLAEATIEKELIFIYGVFSLFDVEILNVKDLNDLRILYSDEDYAYVVRDGAEIAGVSDNLVFADVIASRTDSDTIEIVGMNR